ncbi:MAG: hypothetical protein J0L77_07015 [Alphaproteobacteria bacterium]|nr:hypothetical protein [Alphaproteobacteria bacterium]
MKSKLLLTTMLVMALSAPAYAEEGYGHGGDTGHAHESSPAHSDGHGHTDEKSHFNIQKPETVEAAWAMIDETIASSRQALKDHNADVLHEAGEKLASAVSALHDHPQAVKEENGEKLTQALDQLSKTVDRFHHAAEDKDVVGATESLDLLESQKELVKSLYSSVEQMEP